MKAVAELCKNTKRFERSLLAGVMNSVLSSGNSASCIHSLLGRTAVVCNGVRTSSLMMIFGLHVEVGDLVRHCDTCGIVQMCLLIDDVLYAAVELMEKDGIHSAPWGMWKLTGHHACWLAADLMQVVAWKAAVGDRFLVLV